ncbi:hypothetical protein AcV5_004565 [Taiwanofungus camphoratus]|nr:hypothetical protein AcV5_004565 [Antrodia cinnamomea]
MPTASSNPVRSDVPTANDLHSEKVQSPSPDEVPSSTQISLNPHPLLRRREPSGTDDMDDLPSYDLHKTYHDVHSTLNAQEDSADVTDQLLTATGRLDLNTLRVRSDRAFSWFGKSASKAGSATAEVNVLLPSAHVGLKSATIMASSATDYHKEGGPSSIPSSSAVIQKHLSPPATLVPLSWKRGSHTPVPASAVFARKAPPLSLPTLDKYISSLPIVSFPCVRGEEKGKGKESDVKMFAPMDRLASSGKTLADLEHNSRIAPGWKNRDSIFSALSSIVLGVTGSSALASFYSVHGLFDTLQIFALILNTLVSHNSNQDGKWRTLFLVKIPNILALNFASTLTESLVLLIIFMVISGILLYYFHRVTRQCRSLSIPEGQQRVEYPKNPWAAVIVSFLLTVIYLPLSTMAVHVLVWSDDLWVVPNPYINATSFPPSVPVLGPSDQYRAPLDFCWTTTMELNEINYAPVIVILATICFLWLTVWFPIHLYRTIRTVAPVVDPYTELGVLRSRSDMNREYQRLLDRDRNPLCFLYNGFRRGWATYESMFLLAKLTTLLTTAVIDPDNCLFRSLSRSGVQVARQIILVIAMLVYFIFQCVFAPFLNPVNNASEWTSRMNYVLTSAIALGVALDIPGQKILNGVVLYAIYIVTYGLSLYFTIIDMDVMRRVVKRLARRVDFSIDMFSPRVDISSSSPHTKRRIWQEAITTLVLTSPDCEIPKTQAMEFKQARDNEYPPYLLNFAGTPGERLVENLKILREIGSVAYYTAVGLMSGPEHARIRHLEEAIQNHFIGPDCYWKPPAAPIPNCTNFFGNAWWIPFPPTLVIHYDSGSLRVLQEASQFELYVAQNSSHHIQRKREIRIALRALDGQLVTWPYDYTRYVGSREAWCCCGRRYGVQTSIHYRSCVLNIKRSGRLLWEGVDLGSGFTVELTYAKNVKADGSLIGLTDDYDLTQPLARFFALNEQIIAERLPHVEAVLRGYRHHSRWECLWKEDTLTYRSLTSVYDQPQSAVDVAQTILKSERDLRVRELVVNNETVFEISYARFSAVSNSALATWWYIFWDDLWRRNYDTISAMRKYASDFNPHYPTSIAYTPLPRAVLEAFLTQRGLLHKVPKWGDFFYAGFLNKMYLRMNDIVFHGTDGVCSCQY